MSESLRGSLYITWSLPSVLSALGKIGQQKKLSPDGCANWWDDCLKTYGTYYGMQVEENLGTTYNLFWDILRVLWKCAMRCLGKGPKAVKGRDQHASGRNKLWEREQKRDKSGQPSIYGSAHLPDWARCLIFILNPISHCRDNHCSLHRKHTIGSCYVLQLAGIFLKENKN